MRLTKAQRQFLQRIERRGGILLCRDADMRVHAGLLKRDLIALTYVSSGQNGYTITDLGRAALAQSVEKK